MSATIKVFQVAGKSYTHVMNASHDSVELRDQGNEILLTFGANAKVTNQNGQLGNFIVEYIDGQPRWVYYENLHQMRTVFGPNLHTAEVEVSRRFIGRFDSRAGEHEPALA
jgi:hypothetical protein